MEEPQIHLLAARGYVDKVINPEFMLKVFNNTVKGLRAKTEVWCHTCWGNPSQQRMFGSVQSYKPALALLNQVDADVITFEMKSSNMMDLHEIGAAITDMKVCVGAIDHHTLQVEAPTEVADLIRQALTVIPAERLVLVVGLRDGARGDEPAACLLQDGVAGAGHEHRQEGTRAAGDREPRGGPEVLADSDDVGDHEPRRRGDAEAIAPEAPRHRGREDAGWRAPRARRSRGGRSQAPSRPTREPAPAIVARPAGRAPPWPPRLRVSAVWVRSMPQCLGVSWSHGSWELGVAE